MSESVSPRIGRSNVLLAELLEAGASGLSLPLKRGDELSEYDGRCNAVFVAEIRAEHEPNGFLVAERDFVSLSHEVQRRVANVLEAYGP